MSVMAAKSPTAFSRHYLLYIHILPHPTQAGVYNFPIICYSTGHCLGGGIGIHVRLKIACRKA